MFDDQRLGGARAGVRGVEQARLGDGTFEDRVVFLHRHRFVGLGLRLILKKGEPEVKNSPDYRIYSDDFELL